MTNHTGVPQNLDYLKEHDTEKEARADQTRMFLDYEKTLDQKKAELRNAYIVHKSLLASVITVEQPVSHAAVVKGQLKKTRSSIKPSKPHFPVPLFISIDEFEKLDTVHARNVILEEMDEELTTFTTNIYMYVKVTLPNDMKVLMGGEVSEDEEDSGEEFSDSDSDDSDGEIGKFPSLEAVGGITAKDIRKRDEET